MAGVMGLGTDAPGLPALEPESGLRKGGGAGGTPPSEALSNWHYCLGCHKSGQAMKRCGGCRAAYFCDSDCQLKAWKRAHKQVCQDWSSPATLEVADHASVAAHHPLDGARVVSLPRSGNGAVAPAQIVYLPGDDPVYSNGLRLGIRML